MATSKHTRNLQLVTKGRAKRPHKFQIVVSNRAPKNRLKRLRDLHDGPVALTRRQLAEVYDILVWAALDLQDTIKSHIPVGDVQTDLEREVLARAEWDFSRVNRLLYQFEHYFPYQKVESRLHSQVPLREEIMSLRNKAEEIGGAA